MKVMKKKTQRTVGWIAFYLFVIIYLAIFDLSKTFK